MVVGGSTALAAVPSESAAMAAGLLVVAVVGGLLCMVAEKPFCHRSCPETPSESDSTAAGVLEATGTTAEASGYCCRHRKRLPVRVLIVVSILFEFREYYSRCVLVSDVVIGIVTAAA